MHQSCDFKSLNKPGNDSLNNSLDIRQTDVDKQESDFDPKSDLVVSYLEEVKKRKRLS